LISVNMVTIVSVITDRTPKLAEALFLIGKLNYLPKSADNLASEIEEESDLIKIALLPQYQGQGKRADQSP